MTFLTCRVVQPKTPLTEIIRYYVAVVDLIYSNQFGTLHSNADVFQQKLPAKNDGLRLVLSTATEGQTKMMQGMIDGTIVTPEFQSALEKFDRQGNLTNVRNVAEDAGTYLISATAYINSKWKVIIYNGHTDHLPTRWEEHLQALDYCHLTDEDTIRKRVYNLLKRGNVLSISIMSKCKDGLGPKHIQLGLNEAFDMVAFDTYRFDDDLTGLRLSKAVPAHEEIEGANSLLCCDSRSLGDPQFKALRVLRCKGLLRRASRCNFLQE